MNIRVNKEIIKSLKPCTDRDENFLRHYPNFDGQIEEFLDLENITYQDKIWVAVRLMPRFLAEVFAIDCAVRAAYAATATANYAAANYAYAAANYAYAAANYAYAAANYAYAAANYAYAAAADYAYAYATANYAYAAAADYAVERQNQIESIIYLVQSHKEN